jgi:hypothetical protein
MNEIWQQARRPYPWLLAMIGACLVTSHSAVAQDKKDQNSALVQTPIPTGPYASWPDDLKKKTVDTLMFRCTMVGVMQLGNYSGPKEAGNEYLQGERPVIPS